MVTQLKQDRLFVPLKGEAYDWFASGGKKWEVRKLGRQWTEKNVRTGRRVELRRGYNGESLWGVVGGVVIQSDLWGLFSLVDYREVSPLSSDLTQAVGAVRHILGYSSMLVHPVIAFEVLLDSPQTSED
jgi:hypothetical protein